MAEEAAQEQPSPTAPRKVRCIVKLGTLSRCLRFLSMRACTPLWHWFI